jgi:hypothetical protein
MRYTEGGLRMAMEKGGHIKHIRHDVGMPPTKSKSKSKSTSKKKGKKRLFRFFSN